MSLGEKFLINVYFQCLNYSCSKLLVLNLAFWGEVPLGPWPVGSVLTDVEQAFLKDQYAIIF